MKKFFKLHHLNYFFSFIAILIFIIIWLISTNSGLQASVFIINKVFRNSIHITNASGKLIKNVYIDKIIFTTPDKKITLLNTKINYYPLGMFLNKFNINNLHIENIAIDARARILNKQTNDTPAKINFENIKLAIIINAKKITIDTVAFNNFTTPIYLHDIYLKAKNSINSINIYKFSAWYDTNKLTMQGEINFRALDTKVNARITNNIYKTNNRIADIKIDGSLKHDINLNINTYNIYTHSNNNTQNGSFNLHINNAINFGEIVGSGKWNDANLPLSNNTNILLKNGSIDVNGNLKKYNVKISSLFNTANFNNISLNLSGYGDINSLTISRIDANWPTVQEQTKASIFGFLNIKWFPYLTFISNLQFHNVDFGILKSILTTNINMGVAIKYNEKENLFSLNINELYGTINKKNIHGHISYVKIDNNNNGNIFLRSKDISSDLIKIKINKNELMNANWNINIDNIKNYINSANGSIKSYGAIKTDKFFTTENLHKLILKSQTKIDNFNFSGNKINNLVITNDINLSKKYNNIFTLSADSIIYDIFNINKLNIKTTGDNNWHNLSLSANIQDDNLQMQATGSYTNNNYSIKINSFNAVTKNFGNWLLDKEINILIAPQLLSVSPFCFSNKTSSICGNFKYEKNLWNLIFNTKNLPAKFISKYFTKDFIVDSTINTNINFTSTQNKIDGTASINTSPGKFIFPNFRNKELNFLPSEILITPKNKLIEFNGDINFPNNSFIKTNFKISQKFFYTFNYIHSYINGTFSVKLDNLNFLQNVSYYFNVTNGSLNLDTKFSGPLLSPNISGTCDIKNANLNLTITNTNVNNVNVNIKVKNHFANIKANANIKNQNINIAGICNFANRKFESSLAINGKNIPLLALPDMQINISPNIILEYTKPNFYLTGNTFIDSANIDLSGLSPIEMLPDNVIIVTNNIIKKKTAKKSINFYLDHKITLNNKNIKISYLGFSSNLTGEFNIKTAPKEYLNATGAINFVDGKYSAHGANLFLNSGKFIYTNQDITNPNIDFLATKKIKYIQTQNIGNISDKKTLPSSIQNVTVGIKATGTLQQPKVQLFANPSILSDSDILSYLILNSPSGGLDSSKSAFILQTVRNFSIGGVNVIDELQQAFGISEIGIDTEPVIDPIDQEAKENTYFMIGKQITPRLHASYRSGLIIPDNIFRLSYLIDRHWTLQTESSTYDNSADIFYTIDR